MGVCAICTVPCRWCGGTPIIDGLQSRNSKVMSRDHFTVHHSDVLSSPLVRYNQIRPC